MVRDQPYYSLKKAKRLAQKGEWLINKKARNTAREHFGWRYTDIKKAFLKLQPKHFYKSDRKYDNPEIWIDFYKAEDLMGENIYLHFRIEDNKLVICSFKEI